MRAVVVVQFLDDLVLAPPPFIQGRPSTASPVGIFMFGDEAEVPTLIRNRRRALTTSKIKGGREDVPRQREDRRRRAPLRRRGPIGTCD